MTMYTWKIIIRFKMKNTHVSDLSRKHNNKSWSVVCQLLQACKHQTTKIEFVVRKEQHLNKTQNILQQSVKLVAHWDILGLPFGYVFHHNIALNWKYLYFALYLMCVLCIFQGNRTQNSNIYLCWCCQPLWQDFEDGKQHIDVASLH